MMHSSSVKDDWIKENFSMLIQEVVCISTGRENLSQPLVSCSGARAGPPRLPPRAGAGGKVGSGTQVPDGRLGHHSQDAEHLLPRTA